MIVLRTAWLHETKVRHSWMQKKNYETSHDVEARSDKSDRDLRIIMEEATLHPLLNVKSVTVYEIW